MVDVYFEPNDFDMRSRFAGLFDTEKPYIEISWWEEDENSEVQMRITRKFAGQIVKVLQKICDEYDEKMEKTK